MWILSHTDVIDTDEGRKRSASDDFGSTKVSRVMVDSSLVGCIQYIVYNTHTQIITIKPGNAYKITLLHSIFPFTQD